MWKLISDINLTVIDCNNVFIQIYVYEVMAHRKTYNTIYVCCLFIYRNFSLLQAKNLISVLSARKRSVNRPT